MRIRIQPFVAPVTSSEGIPVSPTNGTQLSLLRLNISRLVSCRGFISMSDFLGFRYLARGSKRSGRSATRCTTMASSN